MKVDIWVNNIFLSHDNTTPEKIEHISLKHFKRVVSSDDHLYILRGEPSIHPNFLEMLKHLEGKNFILSTHGLKYGLILNKKQYIPYLSIKWDGLRNDILKGQPSLTYGMFKLLDFFKNNKDTQLRIEYLISNRNIDWFQSDVAALRNIYSKYDNMKQPYFIINQQSEILKKDSTFVPFGADHLDMLNRTGLLTKKNLDYIKATLDKKDYLCTSVMNEATIHYDGTIRVCQSHKFDEILGSLDEDSFDDIMNKSMERRKDLEMCPLRANCWLAYHYKDNIADNKRVYKVG